MKLSVAQLKRDHSLNKIPGAKSLHSVKKSGHETQTSGTVDEADTASAFN